MALKSSIFKLELSVSNIDDSYYNDHSITIAQHPSENNLRMFVRIIAFALNADTDLVMAQGLCVVDEPDLWKKDLVGNIDHWIDLGQVDEKRIRKACGRSKRVSIYTYQPGPAQKWYESNTEKLARFPHLQVSHLILDKESVVEHMVARTITLQITIQDGQAFLSDTNHAIEIAINTVKQAISK